MDISDVRRSISEVERETRAYEDRRDDIYSATKQLRTMHIYCSIPGNDDFFEEYSEKLTDAIEKENKALKSLFRTQEEHKEKIQFMKSLKAYTTSFFQAMAQIKGLYQSNQIREAISALDRIDMKYEAFDEEVGNSTMSFDQFYWWTRAVLFRRIANEEKKENDIYEFYNTATKLRDIKNRSDKDELLNDAIHLLLEHDLIQFEEKSKPNYECLKKSVLRFREIEHRMNHENRSIYLKLKALLSAHFNAFAHEAFYERNDLSLCVSYYRDHLSYKEISVSVEPYLKNPEEKFVGEFSRNFLLSCPNDRILDLFTTISNNREYVDSYGHKHKSILDLVESSSFEFEEERALAVADAIASILDEPGIIIFTRIYINNNHEALNRSIIPNHLISLFTAKRIKKDLYFISVLFKEWDLLFFQKECKSTIKEILKADGFKRWKRTLKEYTNNISLRRYVTKSKDKELKDSFSRISEKKIRASLDKPKKDKEYKPVSSVTYILRSYTVLAITLIPFAVACSLGYIFFLHQRLAIGFGVSCSICGLILFLQINYYRGFNEIEAYIYEFTVPVIIAGICITMMCIHAPSEYKIVFGFSMLANLMINLPYIIVNRKGRKASIVLNAIALILIAILLYFGFTNGLI